MSAQSLYRIKHEVRRRQRLWQLRGLRHARTSPALSNDPITVYGLFSGASGLAQACRLIANNLERIGRTVFRVDTAPHLFGRGADPAQTFDTDPGHGPILFHLNPVEAAEIMAAFAPKQLARRPRIGLWLYELERAPEHWAHYVGLFDAIWSPSEASASALRSVGADPYYVPYCHDPLSLPATQDNRSFTVLSMGDYRSSLARKNMRGAIQAYARAFTPDQETCLQLKIVNLPKAHPIRTAIASRADIQLLETRLPYTETLSLIARSDCYLSLHRSEGYGLSVVEAMQLGTPVIMTDEQTTRALQLPGVSQAVPSRPTMVDDPQRIYSGGCWADPDLDRAAEALQILRGDWINGRLAQGRAERIAKAEAAFCSNERLSHLQQALTALTNLEPHPTEPVRSIRTETVKTTA